MQLHTIARRGAAALLVISAGACANMGSLGNVLGGVLAPNNQLTGTVQRVDTRYQQVTLQQSNGQTLTLNYDANTQVSYQNQNYPVTSLEYGDQVVARIQDNGNGSYYTDLIQVTQPVSGSTAGGTVSGNVQSLQGTVRQIDRTSGWFTLDTGNGVLLTISLPYNLAQNDVNRFNNLRTGDFVHLYGVYLNSTQVQLRNFY